MKKKLNISVVDIIQKSTSPKNATLQNKTFNKNPQIIQSPLVVDKPMRFEDLYKKVVDEHSKNNDNSITKIIYQSKKTTPINTCRVKKQSVSSHSGYNSCKSAVSSIVRSGKRSIPSLTSNIAITDPFIKNSKQVSQQNSHNRQQRKSLTKNTPEQPLPRQQTKYSQYKILNKLHEYLQHLNHQQHTHLRQRNQCFLSQKQIDNCMNNLGYNIRHEKYVDFLSLLEVDIYGGAPCENLKKIISIIQQKDLVNNNYEIFMEKKKLPKIVDNNLKINVSDQNKTLIVKYFSSFRLTGNEQKQNQSLMANRINCRKFQTFQNLLKQKTNCFGQQNQKQLSLYSPAKKINSTAISELIQALNQSEQKKSQQKFMNKNQISHQKNQHSSQQIKENEDMQTFRRVQASGFQVGGENQYNFSRSLSGDKILQTKQDQNIIQLKNKLNQALKKSCQQSSQFFSQDRQYSNFLYSNSLKYSKKPILSVDVNLGDGISQKIIVFEGQTAKQVSDRLASKFTISNQTKLKFQKMLQSHLNTMLWKIEQVSQEMFTDRDIY